MTTTGTTPAAPGPAIIPTSGPAPGGTKGGTPTGTTTLAGGSGTAKAPAPTDILSELTGDQRNAYSALTTIFEQYGLGSLAPTILKYVQSGFGSDTISLLLQQTPEYKQRFAANDARVKAGLPALSPGQYLSVEESYRNIMQAAGLPAGFYDNPSDFTQFLTKDVSPTELKTRVDIAQDYLYQADTGTKQALQQYYGIDSSHMLASILDPERAAPLIQRQYAAAQIGGQAIGHGLAIDQSTAEGLVSQGVTQAQAQSGFSRLGAVNDDLQQAAVRDGVDYSNADAVQDFVGGTASAQRKRQQIINDEQAQFAGVGHVGSMNATAAGAY